MKPISIRRVYEPLAGDGQEVLVDRIWPRGKRKADLAGVLWVKEVAPSTELRKWFGHDPARWDEFRRRYFAELEGNPAVARLREMAREAPLTHCTHMLDLAILAAAHAGDAAPTLYEMLVDDPGNGPRQAILRRNGVEALRWLICVWNRSRRMAAMLVTSCWASLLISFDWVIWPVRSV